MSGAPLILSFNTATLGGSVCLVRGGAVLASFFGDPSVSHSSTLLADIARTLKAANVSLGDVELLAAAAGPGSFTGLRIGIATLKALSAALKRPGFGIPTLQAIAHGAGPAEATVAVLPAGRGEVFVQLLSVSPAGVVAELDSAAHLPPSVMLAKYGARHNLKWAGAGAQTHRDLIQEYAASKAIAFFESPQMEIGDAETTPSGWLLKTGEENLAINVAALAWQRFRSGQLESAESLQAIYVRPADAELKKS